MFQGQAISAGSAGMICPGLCAFLLFLGPWLQLPHCGLCLCLHNDIFPCVCTGLSHASPTHHGLGPTLLQVTASYLMTSMKTSFPSKAVHRSWGLELNRSLPGHHSPRHTGRLQR